MTPIVCSFWLVLTLASQHIEPQGMNQRNPGVGLEVDGYIAGVYRNSEYRNSVYVGHDWLPLSDGHLKAGLAYGAITGYRIARIAPMVAGRITYENGRFGANLNLMPDPLYVKHSALGLQIKWRM
jgi:hypothetical protein